MTNGLINVGTPVHDSATLSGQVDGFSFNGAATVTYYFYTNSACTGSPASTEVVTVASDGSVPESTPQTLPSGFYCYKAVYSGNANYNEATSAIEPFAVMQNSLVTDTMLCTLTNNEFRLLFTPDLKNGGLKLNASNPGQFYYNVFYTGAGNVDITITLPYPWVTQGAVPIHVYADVGVVTTNGTTCLTPIDELSNQSDQVTLVNYIPQAFGSTTTVTIHVPALPGGFAYINIHIDYGLKGTTGYAKGGPSGNDAVDMTTLAVRIPDEQPYNFTDTNGGNVTITSINSFKKDPGISGFLINKQTGNPLANTGVEIYQGTNLEATVYTDADGWYMWQYEGTGTVSTYTVKPMNYIYVLPARRRP